MLDWADTTDPDGDPLTYTVEISEDGTDAALTPYHVTEVKCSSTKDLESEPWWISSMRI